MIDYVAETFTDKQIWEFAKQNRVSVECAEQLLAKLIVDQLC